ncbi:hypothetical protein Hanom_Chr10g00904251 [Helianthus anomalus]
MTNLLIPCQFGSASSSPPLHSKSFQYSNWCRRFPPLHMPKPSQSPLLNLLRYTQTMASTIHKS